MTTRLAGFSVPDFASLFDAMPSVLSILLPDLTFACASDGYLAATLTVRQEILGRHVFDVFPPNPADPQGTGTHLLRASLEKVIASGVPDTMPTMRYDIPRPEAAGGGFEERFWVTRNTPVFGANGKVSYIINQSEDVTTISKLETQRTLQTYQLEAQKTELLQLGVSLQAVNKDLKARCQDIQVFTEATLKAQEASRLKSEFLANMGHELRTPLNAIIGFTELVLKSKKASLDERSQDNLHLVKKHGKHLLSLVNDILDLAKIEAGKASVYLESIDPQSVLQAVAVIAGSLAREKGLLLNFEVDPALGAVVTDQAKLQQIVLNLVTNAIKFTPAGRVDVRVVPQPSDRWSVEVEDTGIGIAPEHQVLIFEEFRQVDGSSTRVGGGAGLGLAIAHRLANMLGGELSLGSELGRGSSFRLELPRQSCGGSA